MDKKQFKYILKISPKQKKLVLVRIKVKEDKVDVRIEDLAQAVNLWLNYQSKVCSSFNLLHEASFRYPIAEYLERRARSIAKLEEDHPIFENRPTDFQWKQNGNRYFLECKYVKFGYTNKKQEFQRYVDDLCRLYYCIKNEETDICYLLVCGDKKNVDDCFFESKTNNEPKGGINAKRYNFLLNFNDKAVKELTFDSKQTKETEGMDEDQKMQVALNKAYDHFIEDYKENIPKGKKKEDVFENSISLILTRLHEVKADDEQYVYFWKIQKGPATKIDTNLQIV